MKNTIKGWVARDKDGRLLFYTDKPWKYEGKSWAVPEGEWMEIDKSWYPDVKWEDEEPTETSITMIDERELTHGKTVKMEEAPDDRAYCREHCKGYRESGGKCYFGFNCSVKKEAEAEKKKWIPKFKEGDYITDMNTIYIVRQVYEGGYWCAICDDDCNPKTEVWCDSREEKNFKLYKREPEEKQTIEVSSTKEAEAEKKWIPKFKVGDLFTYNDASNEAKLYTVKRLEQHGCVAGYWCEQFNAPTKGNLWFSYSEEKYMEPELEQEKKQTIEIRSTKEAEEIINFIKDCFNRCRIAFPGADWKRYEAAIEVLRPEYTSYQQGFNAGYTKGYEARIRVEKDIVIGLKEVLDEVNKIKDDEE